MTNRQIREYIQVPVPAHLVPTVMRLIANDDSMRSPAENAVPGTPAPPSEHVAEEQQGDEFWTRPRVEMAYDEASESMKAVLRELAGRPGQKVPMNELVQALEAFEGKPCTWRRVAAILSGFSRRMKGRLGGELPSWPFDVWRGEDGTSVYRMGETVGTWIGELG